MACYQSPRRHGPSPLRAACRSVNESEAIRALRGQAGRLLSESLPDGVTITSASGGSGPADVIRDEIYAGIVAAFNRAFEGLKR